MARGVRIEGRARRTLRRLRTGSEAAPLFAPCLGLVAAAFAVPMFHALLEGDERVARAFLYAGLFTGFAAAIIGVALAGRARTATTQTELITLLAAWILFPVFMAIPLVMLTPQLGWVGAWFEMVLSFTTTGSTGYATLTRVDDSLHLWRGVVAWLGGLMTLTAAYVILAPRRMGGFEVRTQAFSLSDQTSTAVRLAELGAKAPAASTRVHRALRTILPVYAGMTVVLVMLFGLAGEVSLAGVIHAFGIVSTAGVSPSAEGIALSGSIPIEMIAAVFLCAAATSRFYGDASRIGASVPLREDPELRLMALLVLAATALLFVRHWSAALTLDNVEGQGGALTALWGTAFTVLSYLTTTGYESTAWDSAQAWAGLTTPTLILLGLCALGGGAATTAGGIKLIRAAVLLRHGMREVERLAQPMAVHGRGEGSVSDGGLGEGAFLGWAFIMLYSGSIFAVTLALAMTGLNFQTSLVGAIAAVSNTGPAFAAVAEGHSSFANLDALQRVILAAGMVLGRIETLAVIAIFRGQSWALPLLVEKKGGNTGRKLPQSRR
ncbi:MAG: potassium transporter TrkG [Pseudomonadota bacterium]